MDAIDEGEQAGIASQIVAELEEGAQTFFGLTYKVGIALEMAEAHRVVDMGDGNMVAVEGLAQHDIFVAIMAEPLVERMVEHDIATDEEIGRVEMLIGRLLAQGGGVLRGFG